MRCAAIALSLFLAPAVTSAAEQPPTRAGGDLAMRARDILRQHCAGCHTGSSDPGYSKLKVMEYGQLTKGRPVPIVAPGGRSQLLELVRDGSMPPGNRAGPSGEQIEVLTKWVQAGAPAFPLAFDEQYTLTAIADDIDRANGQGTDRTAGLGLRYVSFADRIRDDGPLPDLVTEERQLNAALSATAGGPVNLEPVDSAATLYRIDLTKLGWRTGDFFWRMERRIAVKPYPLRPFDLLLLEYPDGALRPADGSTLAKRLDPFLAAENQVRPVPYLRGDWLTAALVRDGKPTPLATDLASLSAPNRTSGAGPPVPRMFGSTGPFVGLKPAGGRTPIPPLSGWYTGNVTPDPDPFALTAEIIAGGRTVKSVKEGERFKLKVVSKQRVFLTVLKIEEDGEVRVQEIDGETLPVLVQGATPRDLSPGADGFSLTRSASIVLFASEADRPLAPPVVVRSGHDTRPVWRFLLEPTRDNPFDPNRVVRKVLAVPVTKK